MTKKHFIAIHNETGERIEFGVEDIFCYGDSLRLSSGRIYKNLVEVIFNDHIRLNAWKAKAWLTNYTLYYLHQGKYYNYETGKEMG